MSVQMLNCTPSYSRKEYKQEMNKYNFPVESSIIGPKKETNNFVEGSIAASHGDFCCPQNGWMRLIGKLISGRPFSSSPFFKFVAFWGQAQ